MGEKGINREKKGQRTKNAKRTPHVKQASSVEGMKVKLNLCPWAEQKNGFLVVK